MRSTASLFVIFIAGMLASITTLDVAAGEPKKGTALGVMTAKGETPVAWIELKADGEEKARRYFISFKSNPELQKPFKETPIGSRIQVDWVFGERFRVLKMETLKANKP